MKQKNITIKVWTSDSLTELSEEDRLLVNEAVKAARSSYAPYSNFNVGAAVLLENGEIIHGSNQENVAFPSGLCAERIAMFYANSQYPGIIIKAIAISSSIKGEQCGQAVFPCGACRQSMVQSEIRQKYPIKVIMAGEKDIQIVDTIQSLLPLGFDLSNC